MAYVFVEADSKAVLLEAGSEAEFITEHYWGYTKINAQNFLNTRLNIRGGKFTPIRNYAVDVDF